MRPAARFGLESRMDTAYSKSPPEACEWLSVSAVFWLLSAVVPPSWLTMRALVCDPARMAWVTELLGWEETERHQRSLERRVRASHIGKFKPLADYEWDWPRRCDRQAIQ